MSKENQSTSFDDLMEEFEFEVPGVESNDNSDSIEVVMNEEEEVPTEKELTKEGEDAEKTEESEKSKDEKVENPKLEEEKPKDKPKEGMSSSYYKEVALKFIDRGKWSDELAVEGEDGEAVLVKDLEDIDEDTFFQIQEAVRLQEEDSKKDKFISVDKLSERQREIMSIVKEGGDLSKIFQNKEQVEEYLNPFSNLDLDNEAVQERIYLNALVKNNKLDMDTAQIVVDKAKKDLSLDSKVKDYVEKYSEAFGEYVKGKKEQILESKKQEVQQNKEFKKTLRDKYKEFDIKDDLARKLSDSAVNKDENGEFEIDSVYSKKMEDPDEAAELILFLKDKQAYLDFKLQKKITETHKKVRQTVKLIPKDKLTGTTQKETSKQDYGEFEFEVE